MFSQSALIVALASAAIAMTPPGFEPAVTRDLFVAFGQQPALNGIVLPRPVTLTAPTVGTREKLFGTYTIMMVDPDIPPAIVGGPTSELLHWIQPGLVSAETPTTFGNTSIFVLRNPSNLSAIATYAPPSPPARIPLSHRYTQLLLNTTDNAAAVTTLTAFGQNRRNFSAVNVVAAAGTPPLFGNWFNVTNTSGIATSTGGGSVTSTILSTTTAGATATSTPFNQTNDGMSHGMSGAIVAGLGALVAAMVIV